MAFSIFDDGIALTSGKFKTVVKFNKAYYCRRLEIMLVFKLYVLREWNRYDFISYDKMIKQCLTLNRHVEC